MILGLLDRQCLREASRLALFYAIGFLAVMSSTLIAPLINGGAHPLDVLMTLPQQLAMPATIILPMALATALLATVGRMQADGELIALQAAGIPFHRVVLALAPLVLFTTLLVGWLAHWALPDGYRQVGEVKTELLRQAVPTVVARGEPIMSDRTGSLTALEATGHTLHGVCAWLQEDDGSMLTVYAPAARWVSAGGKEQATLRLELDQLRGFHSSAAGATGGADTVAYLDFPALVIDIEAELRDWSLKPDAQDTSALAAAIPRLQVLLTALRDESIAIPEALRQGLPAAGNQAQTGSITDLPPLLLHEHELADEPALQALAARIAAQNTDSVDYLLVDLCDRVSRKKTAREKLIRTTNRDLRGHQFSWHMRWVLSLSPLMLGLLAAGLGLRLGSANTLLAVLIALAINLVALVPGLALTKGMRGHLPFNPGWPLWIPQILMALWGAWACRRTSR